MELEKLKEIYNLILEEKYEDAIECLNNEYCSREYILTILKKYNLEQSDENQKKFEENYKLFLLLNKKLFKAVNKDINEYINSGKLPTKQYDIDILLYNLKIAKRLSSLPENIKETIDKMIIELKNKTDFYSKFESKTIDKFRTNFENEFYEILTSNDPIHTISKFCWTEQNFYGKLTQFKRKYTSKKDREIADYIEKEYQKYIENKINKMRNSDSGKAIYYVPLEEINNLLASNCSIYEYCDKNFKYNVVNITREIKILYHDKANEIISKLEALESPLFQQKLEDIALRITNEPDFSIIDYYLITKLNLIDFKKRLNKCSKEVSVFVSKYSLDTYSKGPKSIFLKESELKSNRIIKGKEITLEEKEAIFKFLEENNISINQFTYRDCLDRLVNGKFNAMQKIKKY